MACGALLLLIVVVLGSVGSGLPASPVQAADRSAWTLRSIDTMAMSKDRLRAQVSTAAIRQELAADHSTGANAVAIEVPYDPASSYSPPVTAGYEATWVQTAHALGLHVWFRSHWNSWQGDYGFPVETPTTSPGRALGTAAAVLDGRDQTSYLGLTYRWILDHPAYFRNGDILTPAAEPENAGIAPYCSGPCMFSSVAVFNQWLQDSMTVDRAAFAALHVKVAVGYWGDSGWLATHGYLTQATVDQMGVLAVDDYLKSPTALVANLNQIESTYRVPIVVGEWGDIWNGGNQALMVAEANATMSAVSHLGYVAGFNYFRDITPPGYITQEGIVNSSTLQLNPAGVAVSRWFHLMSPSAGVPPLMPTPRAIASSPNRVASAQPAEAAHRPAAPAASLSGESHWGPVGGRPWPTSLRSRPPPYVQADRLLALSPDRFGVQLQVATLIAALAVAFLAPARLRLRRGGAADPVQAPVHPSAQADHGGGEAIARPPESGVALVDPVQPTNAHRIRDQDVADVVGLRVAGNGLEVTIAGVHEEPGIRAPQDARAAPSARRRR